MASPVEDGSADGAKRPWLRTLALILLGAGLLFLAVGFVDGGNDLLQYLIPAHLEQDPHFAQNDWFVHETTPYHFGFQSYAAIAMRLGVLVPALLSWHLVTLVLLSWAVLRWTGSAAAHVIAIVLLIAGVRYGWGEYSAFGPYALPAFMTPALTLCLWHAMLRGKMIEASLWLTANAYVHANGALLAALAGLPLVVFGTPGLALLVKERRTWIAVALGAALVAPLLVTIAAKTGEGGAVRPELYEVLFYGRSPHHYAPHLADLDTHLRSIFILAFAGYAFATHPQRRPLFALLVCLVLGFGASAAAVTVIDWPLAARAFPLRLFPLLVVLGACLVAARVVTAASHARLASAVALAGPLVAVAKPLLGLGCLGAAVGLELLWKRRAPPVVASRLPVVLVASALAVAAAFFVARSWSPRWTSWPPPHLRETFDAIARHTPKGSVLVVPPTFSGVQIAADRAVVVDFKCFPLLRGEEIAEWRRRMLAISGLDPLEARRWYTEARKQVSGIAELYDRAYAKREPADLDRISSELGATHALVPQRTPLHERMAQEGRKAIWENRDYALFGLSP